MAYFIKGGGFGSRNNSYGANNSGSSSFDDWGGGNNASSVAQGASNSNVNCDDDWDAPQSSSTPVKNVAADDDWDNEPLNQIPQPAKVAPKGDDWGADPTVINKPLAPLKTNVLEDDWNSEPVINPPPLTRKAEDDGWGSEPPNKSNPLDRSAEADGWNSPSLNKSPSLDSNVKKDDGPNKSVSDWNLDSTVDQPLAYSEEKQGQSMTTVENPDTKDSSAVDFNDGWKEDKGNAAKTSEKPSAPQEGINVAGASEASSNDQPSCGEALNNMSSGSVENSSVMNEAFLNSGESTMEVDITDYNNSMGESSPPELSIDIAEPLAYQSQSPEKETIPMEIASSDNTSAKAYNPFRPGGASQESFVSTEENAYPNPAAGAAVDDWE